MTLADLRDGERVFIDANIFIYHFGGQSLECNPTATLECVVQNCPRRITILRSPAMRETAFDGLINPCVRSRGSGSVAVGVMGLRGYEKVKAKYLFPQMRTNWFRFLDEVLGK